ncbi:MAG: alpha/beta hydrolase-fold protein [Gammaproteobacteria bacterium]|nr:alpha/beta hydrolase-fold protein [Gammaproteobacteria bacterium]
MTIKRVRWKTGRVVTLQHDSKILRDNPLGDPYTRQLDVWLPPGYDSTKKRMPVLFDLVGYTGTGQSHTNWRNFDENVPERADRLIHVGAMGPCIIVFPDCFTALGGNQYINSTAIGNYADYLTRELIPLVDAEFRTHAARDHRGCFGKSSGGYGAIIHGMKYPKYWGAIANHSGDAYFDFVYRNDFPGALNVLAKHRRRKRSAGPVNIAEMAHGTGEGIDDGRVRRFLKYLWQKPDPTSDEIHCLMMLAMAASYDPDPDVPNGFHLPFDLETGELLLSRWRKWLRHDPINLAGRYKNNLKTLRGIFIDCGWRDQYRIHYGTRILSQRLREHGIEHRYEEFDGTHSGIDHRMDISLPYLCKALK